SARPSRRPCASWVRLSMDIRQHAARGRRISIDRRTQLAHGRRLGRADLPGHLPGWPEREPGVGLVHGSGGHLVGREAQPDADLGRGELGRGRMDLGLAAVRLYIGIVLAAALALAGVLLGVWWSPFVVGLALGALDRRARVAVPVGAAIGLLAW